MFIIYTVHKTSSRCSKYIMIGIKKSGCNNRAPRFCCWVQTDEITWHSVHLSGPDSIVGIAAVYGLDGPGIKSRWGRDFTHLPRPALGPPSLLYNGYQTFPGDKEWPGHDADPSPPSSAWSWKGRAIPLLLLWAIWPAQTLSACTRVYFTLYPYCAIETVQEPMTTKKWCQEQ
jgi:hypothetical protein